MNCPDTFIDYSSVNSTNSILLSRAGQAEGLSIALHMFLIQHVPGLSSSVDASTDRTHAICLKLILWQS